MEATAGKAQTWVGWRYTRRAELQPFCLKGTKMRVMGDSGVDRTLVKQSLLNRLWAVLDLKFQDFRSENIQQPPGSQKKALPRPVALRVVSVHLLIGRLIWRSVLTTGQMFFSFGGFA